MNVVVVVVVVVTQFEPRGKVQIASETIHTQKINAVKQKASNINVAR